VVKSKGFNQKKGQGVNKSLCFGGEAVKYEKSDYFLHFIPVIGFFVRLIALLSGLGGVWLYKKALLTKK